MRASYKEDIDSLCLESRGIFVICKDNVKITSEPPVMYEQYTNLENDEWRKLLLRFYHTLEGFIQNYFECVLAMRPFCIDMEDLRFHQKGQSIKDLTPQPSNS